MRLDRFITLNLVRPLRVLGLKLRLRTTDHGPRTACRVLPILMYHSISDDLESGVAPYYRTCTSPRVFREHLALLDSLGYRGVTLSTGIAWLNAPPQPENCNPQFAIRNLKPVAITFDDGFQDFYTAAFPLLQQHGFSATMYLPTAFIGDTRRRFAPSPRRGEGRGEVNPSAIIHQPSAGGARDCLTWSEVRELHAAGIELGSHTVNHPRLVDLEWPEIESEIRNSRSDIEHRLGAAVRSFAYPYAFPQADRSFAENFEQLLARVGYESCVTTEINRPRPGDHPLRLARLPANSDDDAALLAAKLAGDYDWLGFVQYLSKKLRRRNVKRSNLVPVVNKPLTVDS